MSLSLCFPFQERRVSALCVFGPSVDVFEPDNVVFIRVSNPDLHDPCGTFSNIPDSMRCFQRDKYFLVFLGLPYFFPYGNLQASIQSYPEFTSLVVILKRQRPVWIHCDQFDASCFFVREGTEFSPGTPFLNDFFSKIFFFLKGCLC